MDQIRIKDSQATRVIQGSPTGEQLLSGELTGSDVTFNFPAEGDWEWEGTVTLVAQSASKIFDGQPLTRPADVLVYGLPEGQKEEESGYLAWAKVIGETTDIHEALSVELIRTALVGMPGTPLKQALRDAGIGDDVYGFVMDNMIQPALVIVAKDTDVSVISVIGLKDNPGTAFKLFNCLAKDKIEVDMILQSVGRDGTKDISFSVKRSEGENALKCLESIKDTFEYKDIKCSNSVAKISTVGAGMESHPGVAAKMFEALYDANINIQMISTSEIKISVIIEEKYADKALSVVHEAFFG